MKIKFTFQILIALLFHNITSA